MLAEMERKQGKCWQNIYMQRWDCCGGSDDCCWRFRSISILKKLLINYTDYMIGTQSVSED